MNTFRCLNCQRVIALDVHARRETCNSDAVVAAAPTPAVRPGVVNHFTEKDRAFLIAVGIHTELPEVHVARPDGTVRLLQKYGIPVTRENYLRLAFAGNPPEEPLDAELEAELPEELKRTEDDE